MKSIRERFLNADVDVKNTNTENIVENIAKSDLLNRTENYDSSTVRQEAIKDYVTNLVNRNVDENELVDDIKNNINVAGKIEQVNSTVFKSMDIESMDGFDITQSNTTAEEIANEYQSFRDSVSQTINKAVDQTDIVNEVENQMAAGTFDQFLNDLIAKADQAANQSSDTGIDSQSFRRIRRQRYSRPKPRKIRRERFGDLGVNINNITDKSRNTNYNEELVQNVSIASVFSDQEMYDKLSNAYNKTVETVHSVKNAISNVSDNTISNAISQKNELVFEGISIKEVTNFKLTQVNDAKSTVASVSIISDVLEMSNDNDLRAIASDMIDITQKFEEKKEHTSDTSNTAEASQTVDQVTQVKTSLKKSRIAAVVDSIVLGIILIVVGYFALKIFSESPDGKAAKTAMKAGVV